MSFFPRSFVSEPASSFTPLFRLLDDYDTYTNPHKYNHHRRSNGNTMNSFTPKFDVKELAESYELHGELPGIDQKDVEIEFTDAQTITVKGRIERHHQSGTPPTDAVEGTKAPDAIEESPAGHKATVEEEDATTIPSTEVAKTDEKSAEVAAKSMDPVAKFWVSERSVGEFSRSFTFPLRVDQESVTASMKNGILSVTVPKAKKAESRKITIS